MTTYYGLTDTPFARLLLVGSADGALEGVYLADHERAPQIDPDWAPDAGRLDDVRKQFDEYFTGDRRTFELETWPAGSEFQRQVWSALQEIPYGETASYGEIAEQIGRPQASRAVGAANGQNPISIVIPCHRVIGASGRLTGYGWGLAKKSWLLQHEHEIVARSSQVVARNGLR